MGKRIGMEVAVAVAEAIGLCKIDMAAVYPITPRSHIAEHLSDLVADGIIDAEFVTVESEHSAMSAVIGASGAGARSCTATSSQGLMLMHELLPIASAMRLPIVMPVANRAVSGPLNILNDHSDIMPQRDAGWIVFFAENGQESIDLSIQAFKIAEHKDVMLPVSVNIDGFQLTHMVEPFEMPTQEEVDQFLPPFVPHATLHPAKPVTMGAFAMADYFPEIMKAKNENRRIIAIGTTTVRTLEGIAANKNGILNKYSGDINLFIKPGFNFQIIDSMLTNFHLPKSTLIVMISAFAGRDLVMKAYEEAKTKNYRFYSFGDSMLII